VDRVRVAPVRFAAVGDAVGAAVGDAAASTGADVVVTGTVAEASIVERVANLTVAPANALVETVTGTGRY
jgi:hypothetical protein